MTNKVGDTNASWCGKNREKKKAISYISDIYRKKVYTSKNYMYSY